MTLDAGTTSMLARAITAEKLTNFYADPKNLAGFEAWKAARDKAKEKADD
ncbi:hypothetical protein [uncultured Faecalibaculum sp.]|nr:hypothetical protein [uncultured Faecalibaculum sp.]